MASGRPGSGGRRAGARARLEALRAPEGVAGDRLLDTVGLYCPVPILRTAETIVGLASGQILEILSDDRVILADMPAWCLSTGHHYRGYREEPGQWRLFVEKK